MPGKSIGKVNAKKFDEFLVLGFSDKWLCLTKENRLEFDVKLTKKGELVLTACLDKLVRTNGCDY